METVHVTRTIPAPRAAVFDRPADHANYERFRGIHASKLLREGEPPPDGLGAVREIKVRPLAFHEEITVYQRPTRFDYLIVKLNVPFEHHGGSIQLTADGDATHVDWRSSFTVPTPLVGRLQEAVWKRLLTRGFDRVLEDVERMVAEPSS